VDLSKYVDLFLSEGREHIVELTQALGEMEHTPSAEDSVAAAFRAVHSIKGMAAAMGYTVVTEHANAMESALDALRRGDEHATPSRISGLIEESDALAREIESAVVQHTAGEPVSGASAATAPEPARKVAAHVRVRASRLDELMNLVGELEIARGRLDREQRRVADAGVSSAFDAASRLMEQLRDQVISARMVPVGQVFERFPRLVRETARTLDKEVEFTLDGAEIELDRSILDRIGDPVMHLLRNALDHGIETPEERKLGGKPAQGRLTLSAQREAGYVLIRVADDGRGIDRDRVLARAHDAGIVDWSVDALDDIALLRVLAHPGFSTSSIVTSVSGRGVGMDVVDAAVRVLGGTIEIRTVGGRGTAITLRLPLSVAIVRSLIARVGSEFFAIPFTHVLETLAIEPPASVVRGEAWATTEIDGAQVAVVMLRSRFGLAPRMAEEMPAVSVLARGHRAALVVDEFVGQHDIVVKQFDPPHGGSSMFAGATVLADGAPALIVDVNSLI
jgi:two-component system chemotaxis sensor kinase CheA